MLGIEFNQVWTSRCDMIQVVVIVWRLPVLELLSSIDGGLDSRDPGASGL
jgi:hypothetical protein